MFMFFMLANLILSITPTTRFFSFKRYILNLLGIKIVLNSKICGDVKFYGGGKITIGDECWIGIGAKFYTSPGHTINIGDRCDIAPEVCFTNGGHYLGNEDRRAGEGKSDNITIGSGTWIGFNCTILAGCTLSKGTFVAAGSLMLGKHYEGNVMYVGIPGSVKRMLK